MKTAFNTNRKDNVAAATVLTATFIAIMGSIVTSNDARADRTSPTQCSKWKCRDWKRCSSPRHAYNKSR